MDQRVRAFMEPPLDPAPGVPTRDVTVDGPHGPVPVRVYGDPDGSGRPALLWLHGGAFMFGDLDMGEADRTAREVCARAGAVVVSVDYRLAVGGVHHPVPLDDVVAAVRWLRDSAADLGVDAHRITLGGASAGGNLATAGALRLRDEDGWQPAGLIPVYPVLHVELPMPSDELVARLAEIPPMLFFTPEATAAINVNYLGGPLDLADGYSFPALADVAGLCPTLLINAEYDDLRASGEAFVGPAQRSRRPGARASRRGHAPRLPQPLGHARARRRRARPHVADRLGVHHSRPLGVLMSESQVSRVLVVGGGITGGVLSLALAQKGVEVVLVDLRPELGGVGHGITLQGNALKAFNSVGIYDQLAEKASRSAT